MKNMHFLSYFRAAALLLCIAAVAGGCASSGGKSYTPGEARQVQTIQRGVLLAIDEVTIEQGATLLGPGVGGVLGGVLGSTIGRSKGRTLATAGGAAVGAALGALGEKAMRTEQAYEFTIELENNAGTISIVQAADDVYTVGDKVRVLRGAKNTVRVVRAP